jgi:ribosomal protein S18 acetylase RimI-like enzyme
MTLKAILRKTNPSEQAAVQDLVQRVVDETYGGLWAEPPLTIDVEDWRQGWVAVVDGEIAGAMLTHEDWLSDLWMLPPFRSVGIGALLLRQAEAEIAGRKYATARLRVVASNNRAQAFYRRHGWVVQREFAHENLPITMIEMAKALPAY